jgi:hypothetical protein
MTATNTQYITTTTDLSMKRRDNRLVKARVPNPVLEVRQVTISATNIPAYASPCSGSVRYSSACSCNGFTQMTTTVAAPLTTVTATVTSTVLANDFTASCQQLTLDGSFLEAQCLQDDQGYRQTSLDLDLCVANINGILEAQ